MDKACCDKDNENVPILAAFLSIISEENRLKIICLLQKCDEKCVCEIQEFLNLSQNLVSHHLKVLRDFGLLSYRKKGLNVYYSVKHQEISKYQDLLIEILQRSDK